MTVEPKRTRIPGKIDPGIISSLPVSIPNLWGWWSADMLQGLSEGNLVSTLTDFSGNDRDGTSSGSFRPTFRASVINSRAALQFSGNQYFDLGVETILPEATWFVVWKKTVGTAEDAILVTNGAAYSYLQYGSNWYYTAPSSIVVAMGDNVSALKCAKYDGNNVSMYTNGTFNSAPVSTATCTVRYIGAGGFALNGYIAEVIIYNTVLDDTSRIFVEKYINAKYNLWV